MFFCLHFKFKFKKWLVQVLDVFLLAYFLIIRVISVTIAFSVSPKIGVRMVKEKNINPILTPAHLKSDSDLSTYIWKITSILTSLKNMRLRLTTVTPQPWLKLKQLFKSLVSRLVLRTSKSRLWSTPRLGLANPKSRLV